MYEIDTDLTSDKVVAELRREILYGTLRPYQELYQDKIAQELGVSRMPVREALQVLANDGFVTVRPKRAAIVNEISDKFIRDFYDVRILLESTAVQAACARQPDCAPAWEAYQAAEEMIRTGDFKGYYAQNKKIHLFIWQAADNAKLQQIMGQMWHTMAVEMNTEGTAKASNNDHRELIHCIENNDPARATDIMRRHIENSCQQVLTAIQASQDDPAE